MKVVIDTNVLVSGMISPDGRPGIILGMITNESLHVCYDSRIFAEYREVLGRSEFHLNTDRIVELLAQIIGSGEKILASPLALSLPDPSDMAFLEVALTANAECLITGNLRHFPSSCRQGMRVLSPAEFLEFYRDPTDWSGGAVKSPDDEYRVSKRAGNRKDKAPSSRNACPMSFSEFTRRIDAVREPGNVNWTPEEVEKVIRSIRRNKIAPKRPLVLKKASRSSEK